MTGDFCIILHRAGGFPRGREGFLEGVNGNFGEEGMDGRRVEEGKGERGMKEKKRRRGEGVKIGRKS